MLERYRTNFLMIANVQKITPILPKPLGICTSVTNLRGITVPKSAPSKKLGATHHCQNIFPTKIVYNSNFVNTELFKPQVVQKLKSSSSCKNMPYSDVVQEVPQKLVNRKVVCESRTLHRRIRLE